MRINTPPHIESAITEAAHNKGISVTKYVIDLFLDSTKAKDGNNEKRTCTN